MFYGTIHLVRTQFLAIFEPPSPWYAIWRHCYYKLAFTTYSFGKPSFPPRCVRTKWMVPCVKWNTSHNWADIKLNPTQLYLPEISGCHTNAIIKSCEMSQPVGWSWYGLGAQTHQKEAHFKAPDFGASSWHPGFNSKYTQARLDCVSVEMCSYVSYLRSC